MPHKYNGNCAYANEFLVLDEGLDMVILKTCYKEQCLGKETWYLEHYIYLAAEGV